MRFSAALTLSCAISAIASPIVARDNTAVAAADAAGAASITEALVDFNAPEGKGEKLYWTGDDGVPCSGRVRGGRVHIKRNKKPGHKLSDHDIEKVSHCLDGFNKVADTGDSRFEKYRKATNDYYSPFWLPLNPPPSSIAARNDNADMAADAVSVPESAADIDAAEDKGERLVWTGDDGSSCSGRVHKGIVHIKRKKGRHTVTKADAMKILACIHGYDAMAKKDPHFKSYQEKTDYYYQWQWKPNDW